MAGEEEEEEGRRRGRKGRRREGKMGRDRVNGWVDGWVWDDFEVKEEKIVIGGKEEDV